ncbi:MAG: hypothetical protein Q7S28_02710 [bacterium]|nr:hypothetical protein [bacterium]
MSYLEKLQSANENTKRIVLIAGSILGMAVIVFLWLHFAGPLITKNNGVAVQTSGVAGQNDTSQPSFLANVANGVGYLGSRMIGFVESGARALTSPKSYTIKP